MYRLPNWIYILVLFYSSFYIIFILTENWIQVHFIYVSHSLSVIRQGNSMPRESFQVDITSYIATMHLYKQLAYNYIDKQN